MESLLSCQQQEEEDFTAMTGENHVKLCSVLTDRGGNSCYPWQTTVAISLSHMF